MNKTGLNKIGLTTFLLLILLINFSCNNPCQVLYKELSSYDTSRISNTIDLKDVFPFSWDCIYIIQPSMYPEDIAKIIGAKCDCKIVPDGQRLFIFMKGEKVVKKSYVHCKGFLFIGQDDPKGFFKIKDTSSIFEIDRQEDGFFLLRPSRKLCLRIP